MLDMVDAMIRELDQDRMPSGRIGYVYRYLRGNHDIPTMPDKATDEYTALARQSITNWLPLISGTFVKQLYVDGYRSGNSADNLDGWNVWLANKLNARQSIPMRGAIEYGAAYVSAERSRIRCLPPRKSYALFQNDEDEFPLAGIAQVGQRISETGEFLARYEFVHDGMVRVFERVTGRRAGVSPNPNAVRSGSSLEIGTLRELPEAARPVDSDVPVPWVRFLESPDEDADDGGVGAIRPLIRLQDRVNASVFYLMMALHYASFRQRWATGLVIPRDTQETLPDGTANPQFGRPIEPFNAAVNKLWVSESADTKFGDFDQTETSGHLAAIENAFMALISIGQSSPLIAAGNHISNVAIESIAALNESMNSQVDAYKTNFGESWETVFDLAGVGDARGRVRWRDTEPRSFAQVIDGLVKLHQIGAPASGLFEMVPRITDQQLEQWKTAAEQPTDTDRLADAIARQSAPALPDAAAGE